MYSSWILRVVILFFLNLTVRIYFFVIDWPQVKLIILKKYDESKTSSFSFPVNKGDRENQTCDMTWTDW